MQFRFTREASDVPTVVYRSPVGLIFDLYCHIFKSSSPALTTNIHLAFIRILHDISLPLFSLNAAASPLSNIWLAAAKAASDC